MAHSTIKVTGAMFLEDESSFDDDYKSVIHILDPVSDEHIFCDGVTVETTTHIIKQVKKGGITCSMCLIKLKLYKSVRL